MSNSDIIRAWKDEDYRDSLSEEQRSHLPENPAGEIELSDEEMESLAGGASVLCCQGPFSRWLTYPRQASDEFSQM
jgi:mersacidin/lichenicidin family type 2 lantibiotic